MEVETKTVTTKGNTRNLIVALFKDNKESDPLEQYQFLIIPAVMILVLILVIAVWCICTPSKKSSDDDTSQSEVTGVQAAEGAAADGSNTYQCENRIQFLNFGIYP